MSTNVVASVNSREARPPAPMSSIQDTPTKEVAAPMSSSTASEASGILSSGLATTVAPMSSSTATEATKVAFPTTDVQMKKNVSMFPTSGAKMDEMIMTKKEGTSPIVPASSIGVPMNPMASPVMVDPQIIYNEMLQSLGKIVGSLSVIADKYAKRPDRPAFNKNMSKKLMAKPDMGAPQAMKPMKAQKKQAKKPLITNTSANNSATNTSATNTSANNSATNTSATNEPAPPNNTSLEGGSRRNKKSRSMRKKKGKTTRRRST